MADLIDIKAISDPLRRMDAALRSGEGVAAADHGAEVLYATFRRCDPPIGAPRHNAWHSIRRLDALSAGFGPVVDDGEYAKHLAAGLEAWLVPLSLGMSPPDYRQLRASLGVYALYGDGHSKVYRNIEPTKRDSEWASDRLVEVLLRLWELGVIQSEEGEDAGDPEDA